MPRIARQDLEVVYRPLDQLVAYCRNARTHSPEQISEIAGSIKEFGFTSPVLVAEDNTLIAGHGRILAARQLGMTSIPTITVGGLTDTQRRALVLADNRIALNAGWDKELLAVELGDLRDVGLDLGLTGFGAAELNDLLQPVDGHAQQDDDDADEVPAVDAAPLVRPGDLWRLGPHRLLCGDSTDAASVARVMDGSTASLCFTSPPYAQQRQYTTGGISNWDALLCGVFANLPVDKNAQVLVNLGLVHRDNEWQSYWSAWIEWMQRQGWRRFGWYVWDQGPALPGDWNGRLGPSFEFIFHFNRQVRRPNKTVECRWAGHVNTDKGGLRGKDGTVGTWQHAGRGVQDHRIPDSVIRITRHKARGVETEHPAVFPVGLAGFAQETYSDAGAVCFEPFSGAGTSIIAAQRTGRRMCAIELAPKYVDVTLRRWRALFPDNEPVLEGDERGYVEVCARREREVPTC